MSYVKAYVCRNMSIFIQSKQQQQNKQKTNKKEQVWISYFN